MPEYQCGNCREISRLGPAARFCPYCGSSSLNLVIKEEQFPGVADVVEFERETARLLQEVPKPRRRKQASE